MIGIDISGFTGILPLRSLSDSKFFQTYGRAARLDLRDRKKLEEGLLDPTKVDGFIKKYAWIIIPEIIHESGFGCYYGFSHSKVFINF